MNEESIENKNNESNTAKCPKQVPDFFVLSDPELFKEHSVMVWLSVEIDFYIL